jgi:BirA family biotin operon repressor/biotin-[acetyl-CoA-carboxylase] ligase
MGAREKVLQVLKRNLKEFVSGEDLGQRLGISRTAVWKHIRELQKEGYRIESSTKKGYRLMEVPDLLLPSEVQRGLATESVGRDIRYFKEIGSTSDYAKGLAKEGAPEGTVVVAEVQTGGRGRMGREWVSPVGGVWMSIILRPKLGPSEAQKITLICGVALARVLNRSYPLDARIKWPNDIHVKGKKVAGILTEMEAEMDAVNFVVVGIGINVNFGVQEFPEELREGATSIQEEVGEEVSRPELVRDVLQELERVYRDFSEGRFQDLMEEWKVLSSTLGKRVKILTRKEPMVGKAVGITKDGALVLEKEDGSVVEVMAGECIHLRGEGVCKISGG